MKSKVILFSLIVIGIVLLVLYEGNTFSAGDLFPEEVRLETKEISLLSTEESFTDKKQIDQFFDCMDKVKVRKSISAPTVDGGISLKIATASSSLSVHITGKYISVDGDVYRTSQDISDEIHGIFRP